MLFLMCVLMLLACSSVQGNETLDSIKCRKFLDQLLKKDSAPWSYFIS